MGEHGPVNQEAAEDKEEIDAGVAQVMDASASPLTADCPGSQGLSKVV